MTAKKRIAAVLLAVLCVVLLAAPFMMALEAHHDCCGKGCEVCEQMIAMGTSLRAVGLVAFLIMLAVSLTEKAVRFSDRTVSDLFFATPVTLKVKLSN